MASQAKIPKKEPISAVLGEQLTAEVATVEVVTAPIKDKKNTSEIVKCLNKNAPIPELQHLKRVSANRVLISFKTDMENMTRFLQDRHFDPALLGEADVVKVAKNPPKTRRQYNKACELWPCNFHPDSHLEKLVTNTLFNDSEVEKHKFYMNKCLELSANFDTTVALVINRKCDKIVAFGRDKTSESPIRHPVMVAVDNVAKTQGGGLWEYDETDLKIKDILQENMISNSSKDDYLCTDFIIYTLFEPCIMCAMALVHSRMKRVFYGDRSPDGGLGSLCKLHLTKGLNHHYEVFEGILREDCRRMRCERRMVS